MRGWTLSLVALIAMTGLAQAQTAIKPAIVYANGGKFDKSYNEGVSNGAKKFADETKAGCPVSKALSGIPDVSVEASLAG